MYKIKSAWLRFRDVFFDSFLKGQSFAFWGILIIGINFVLLHAQGFASDMEFWRHWIKMLQSGVGNFTGDYPPLYILWLRVVAVVYNVTNLSLDMDYELKQLCLFPVILAHISLAHFVWLRLKNRSWAIELKWVAMLLVVANPAFYLDGPVWGQVDVLPVTICVWALWYASRPKTYALGMALFVLGLLTKFQMITFLPVFGALSFRYRKIIWQAILSAGGVFLVVFLPFILSGTFVKEFSQAYFSTLNSYPYAAMNAGNLWMALVGNMTPDSRPLFDFAPAFLNPGLIGKILFVLVSVAVMVVAFFKRLSAGKLMVLASFNALAFFMLLPCMHERYVLASAIMCIAGAVCLKKFSLTWPLVLSILAFVNIAMMISIRGAAIWFWIALAGMVALLLFGYQLLFPNHYQRTLAKVGRLPVPGVVPYVLLAVIYFIDFGASYAQMSESAYKLKDNETFVYDLKLLVQEEGYGTSQIGKTIDGNPLHLNGQLFVEGIGTHSPSRHVYLLPPNADRFRVSCGVDDESGNGVVEFIILVDDREAWRSGRMEGRQIASADVDVSGARTIALVTDELGAKNFDHADWVNPVLTTK
ncbi:MAG: NPCBM/NEW2 domain-containing protein [Fibrobacteraceae bacterium]|nr:NPCBM/NEW2 domain-containing protein [Fibrobacteraceae bacterium]